MSMCSRMLFLKSPITPFAGFEYTNCGLQARYCIGAANKKMYHLGKTAKFIYLRFTCFKIQKYLLYRKMLI